MSIHDAKNKETQINDNFKNNKKPINLLLFFREIKRCSKNFRKIKLNYVQFQNNL